ncbi:MAG TPA: hypothetical protein VKN99_20280 [Polyangia bacterium]|nr:hypothetical protein [Polyangia bacterium]
MTSLRGVLLLVMLGGTGPAAAADSTCGARSREVAASLGRARLAMSPEAAVRASFEGAVRALAECVGDEELWYLLVRSAELGGGVFPTQVANSTVADLKAAVELAARRNPRSARIATIRARVIGGLQAARQAVALDPAYAPAQVTLAAALFAARDAKAARSVLAARTDLARVPGACALLARACLAEGDASEAIAVAEREPAPSALDLYEPGARDERPRRDAVEVAGLAYLHSGQFDPAAQRLLQAAAEGSAAARTALETGSPELRRALDRLARRKGLAPRERALLRELKTPPARRTHPQ